MPIFEISDTEFTDALLNGQEIETPTGPVGVIDLIDADLLKVAAPSTKTDELKLWVEPIKSACVRFSIDTVREVASFISQASHESGGFKRLEENLNYSSKRLMQVWPKRFPDLTIATMYANNPKKLANRVYANRIGNGDEASGDGWRFRGGGLFQLTGRSNYTDFARGVGMTVEEASEYVRTKEGAAVSAAWFFHDRGLDRLAETPGVEDETRRLNGGYIGIEERRKLFNAVVNALLKKGA